MAERSSVARRISEGSFPDLTPFLDKPLRRWPKEYLQYWNVAVQLSVTAAQSNYTELRKTRSASVGMKRGYTYQYFLLSSKFNISPGPFLVSGFCRNQLEN